jgi:hypothetical protein
MFLFLGLLFSLNHMTIYICGVPHSSSLSSSPHYIFIYYELFYKCKKVTKVIYFLNLTHAFRALPSLTNFLNCQYRNNRHSCKAAC